TRLRLHDCSSTEVSEETIVDSADTEDPRPSEETDYRPDTVELESLDEFLEGETAATPDSLAEAMATYESELQSASESGVSDRYSGIRNGYRRQLISVLDEATQAEGWTILEELLDAYHPN